jgi:hypothetical protein
MISPLRRCNQIVDPPNVDVKTGRFGATAGGQPFALVLRSGFPF